MAFLNQHDITTTFQRAAQYVRLFVDRFDPPHLLRLYAFYKQASEGPCKAASCSFFDFRGRQKQEAWKSLGDMTSTEAMLSYVDMVKQVEPEWEEAVGQAKQLAGLGVGVSSMAREEEAIPDEKKTLFDWVKEGNLKEVGRRLEGSSLQVNGRDEGGMAAVHWAADRGHVSVLQLLLERGADVDAQDAEGQTPLHFAASCSHLEVVELLLQKGARKDIMDKAGLLAKDVAITEEVLKLLNSK